MIREQDLGGGEAIAAAGIPPFVNVKGTAAPLDVQNVDTDMIIPKEFLKTIKRTGLGFAAFAEMRCVVCRGSAPLFRAGSCSALPFSLSLSLSLGNDDTQQVKDIRPSPAHWG